MRVVLIGQGGRELALARAIAASPTVTELWVGGDNPGWPSSARRLPDLGDAVHAMLAVGAELVVIGPEGPLAAGLADRLHNFGIPCFGPSQAAAQLETSKAWAKAWLNRLAIATPPALVLQRGDEAAWNQAVERCERGEVVVKADGLAAGKGSLVCSTADAALTALRWVWDGGLGAAGDTFLLEDRLQGPEISVFALCDGARAVPLPACHDYKRLLDGDEGPNTGGMGAVCPSERVTASVAERIVAEVHQPIVSALAAAGTPFRGVLYAGLILHEGKPQVLEFNVRFGDPEAQALLALWADDPLPWLYGAAVGCLPAGAPRFAERVAVCVVLASAGYPGVLGDAVPIAAQVLGEGVLASGLARKADGALVAIGGRALSVVGVGDDLEGARAAAYALADGWDFPGCQRRSDIGLPYER